VVCISSFGILFSVPLRESHVIVSLTWASDAPLHFQRNWC